MVLSVSSLLLGILLPVLVHGIPNGGPGGTDGPDPTPAALKMSGWVSLINCVPTRASDVYVTIKGQRTYCTGAITQRNGIVTLSWSKTFPQGTTGPFIATPGIASGVCPNGTWTPTSVSRTTLPASGISFSYVLGLKIPLFLIASQLNTFMNSVKLVVNNWDAAQAPSGRVVQGSYLQIGTDPKISLPAIPKVVVDIDPCGVCPDLGDGWFYIRDFQKNGNAVTATSTGLSVKVTFESNAVEIVGYHNSLGDSLMPDFNVDNAAITVDAAPVFTNGGLTLSFSGVKLSASITSTGGCNPFGVFDICAAVLGTDNKIKKAVEGAISSALQAPGTAAAIQKAVGDLVATQLRNFGINGTVKGAAVFNGNLVLLIAAPPALCTGIRCSVLGGLDGRLNTGINLSG